MPRARKSAAATPVTWDDVCEIGAVFPGVERSTSYGTPALKVNGKLIVRLKEDGETIVVRVDFFERDLLMRASPETYFITDHYKDYRAVLVRLATVKREQLAELVENEWRRAAPKRAVQAFDAAR